MQNNKKPAGMSFDIDMWKTTLLKNINRPNALCEICVIEKYYCTSSRVINSMHKY